MRDLVITGHHRVVCFSRVQLGGVFWHGKKQQPVGEQKTTRCLCVFFWGGEGETKKHVGTEMVSWLLLMKNLRSMVIYEDKGR